MKMLAKLAVLLTILTPCISTQAEILIYNKTIRGFVSEGEGITDPNDPNIVDWNWDAGEQIDRGFLVLDAEIDPNDATITDINKAVQVEYWKNGRLKYYEQISYKFNVERIEIDDKAYWVLTDIFTPQEDQVLILMVKGIARLSNIGLGSKENRREIPLTLRGSALAFLQNEDEELESTYKETLTVSLRLNHRWTRLANLYWEAYDPSTDYYNPFEWAKGGINKEGQLYGIVKEWLIRRGYIDVESGSGAGGN
jgi:hypothetical protein